MITDEFLEKTKKLKAKVESEGFKVLRSDEKTVLLEKRKLSQAVNESIKRTLESSNKQG